MLQRNPWKAITIDIAAEFQGCCFWKSRETCHAVKDSWSLLQGNIWKLLQQFGAEKASLSAVMSSTIWH